MWKILLAFILVFNIFGLDSTSSVFAQEPRYAECDLCGYCLGKQKPGNWPSCKACLYPAADETDPNSTLLIGVDEITQQTMAPTPQPGHYYTMIGCLSTELGDFQSQGAAGSVVQTLLNLIFRVAGAIAFLYLVYGAFLIITSQGNTEKLNYGRRVVVGAIIGLVFSLSSLLIVNLLANGILKIPGFSDEL